MTRGVAITPKKVELDRTGVGGLNRMSTVELNGLF